MVAMLTISGIPLAIPPYMSTCVSASHLGPYTLTHDYAKFDPLTEMLLDTPGEPPMDWWQTGKQASLNICDYVVAWKRHEGQKRQKVSPVPISFCPASSYHPLLSSISILWSTSNQWLNRRLNNVWNISVLSRSHYWATTTNFWPWKKPFWTNKTNYVGLWRTQIDWNWRSSKGNTISNVIHLSSGR